MIIQRKYEWLGVLYENDPLSKEVIEKAFALTELSEAQKKELLEYNHCNISAFMNIGCGIPGDSYSYFMSEFEKLDKTSPYENGLSFKDVSNIEYEASRKGTAIQLRLVSQLFDSPYRIVGFVAVENKQGVISLCKGWEMTAPFEIG